MATLIYSLPVTPDNSISFKQDWSGNTGHNFPPDQIKGMASPWLAHISSTILISRHPPPLKVRSGCPTYLVLPRGPRSDASEEGCRSRPQIPR